MTPNEKYMRRCIQLALSGSGYVAPNPMVGAVLVYQDRILGEGYHHGFGMPHAEVNCMASVKEEDRHLISSSTLYVSLEPCAHFGKTPPCADLIIRNKISEVVIGCRDPFPEVNGKGVEKLLHAGIRVTVGMLEQECQALNKRFFVFHQQHRPYIILKWAQSRNGAIAGLENKRVQISNVYTNRLVHRWRSEEAAILIGTRTALLDDPTLTTRWWPGKNPVRLTMDRSLNLPQRLQLFNKNSPTIIFNTIRNTIPEEKINLSDGVWYYKVADDKSMVNQIMMALYHLRLQSVIVEGGTRLLQSFIDEKAWDEARVITNEDMILQGGLPAPQIEGTMTKTLTIGSDRIVWYANKKPF